MEIIISIKLHESINEREASEIADNICSEIEDNSEEAQLVTYTIRRES